MKEKPYYKTLLYTPLSVTERFEKLPNLEADAYVLDLEDSVALSKKEIARQNLKTLFTDKPPIKIGVRINPLNSREGIKDILFLLNEEIIPDFIVTTMVKSYQEIIILKNLLKDYSEELLIYSTIETPEALISIEDLSDVCDGFIFGSADFSATIGVSIMWENMLYARYRIITAAAKNCIPAIDTACFNIDNLDLLRLESQKAKELGFTGKAAIHSKQVSIINQIFSIKESDIQKAKEIISAYDESCGELINLNGNLVGPPFIAYAKTIINRVG